MSTHLPSLMSGLYRWGTQVSPWILLYSTKRSNMIFHRVSLRQLSLESALVMEVVVLSLTLVFVVLDIFILIYLGIEGCLRFVPFTKWGMILNKSLHNQICVRTVWWYKKYGILSVSSWTWQDQCAQREFVERWEGININRELIKGYLSGFFGSLYLTFPKRIGFYLEKIGFYVLKVSLDIILTGHLPVFLHRNDLRFGIFGINLWIFLQVIGSPLTVRDAFWHVGVNASWISCMLLGHKSN